MNRKVRGMVFTIISALLFGVTPILASMTYDMGSNANTLTFYRNLMVVPVLLVIMLIKKTPLRVPWKELLFLLAVSVLFSVSTTYMLYESYNYVGVGTAQTIHFLYPQTFFDLFFCKSKLFSNLPAAVAFLMHLLHFFIVLLDMGIASCHIQIHPRCSSILLRGWFLCNCPFFAEQFIYAGGNDYACDDSDRMRISVLPEVFCQGYFYRGSKRINRF